MYVIDALRKVPYRDTDGTYIWHPPSPKSQAREVPTRSDPRGQFDHVTPGTRPFSAAAVYATVRCVLEIWEYYLGRRLPLVLKGRQTRLEIVPRVTAVGDNAWSGEGFFEFGFGGRDPRHGAQRPARIRAAVARRSRRRPDFPRIHSSPRPCSHRRARGDAWKALLREHPVEDRRISARACWTTRRPAVAPEQDDAFGQGPSAPEDRQVRLRQASARRRLRHPDRDLRGTARPARAHPAGAGEALDRRHRPGAPRHPSGICQAIPGEP